MGYVRNFDAVVVGAGNAGLSAAVRLQLSGIRTLLVEKNAVPGGYATSFVRGRFEIDPSMHELCDVGPEEDPGGVRKLLTGYGVGLKWHRVPTCYRIISTYSDGAPMDVTMPTGEQEFLDAVEAAVPGSREASERFMGLMRQVSEALGGSPMNGGLAPLAELRERYSDLLHTGGYTVDEVFDACDMPPRCRDIYSAYWGYLGVDTGRLSFLHYASMLYLYITKGPYIPDHTSHTLVTAMEQRFRALGGTVLYGTRAERFLFDADGGLCGVRTTAGDVGCHFAIANINPEMVYGTMVPPELVPEREKKLATLHQGRICGRMYGAYFCLNRSAQELGLSDHCVFLSGTADTRAEYERIMSGWEQDDYAFFICYNVTDPAFSPEGTCVCSFTTFCRPEDWEDLAGAAYEARKNALAERFLGLFLEKTGIDLRPYVEEVVIASPWTFARYAGAPEGSAYGYATADWDGVVARTMGLEQEFRLPGLYTVGAAGPRGVGYNSNMTTGQTVAELAMRREQARGLLTDLKQAAGDLVTDIRETASDAGVTLKALRADAGDVAKSVTEAIGGAVESLAENLTEAVETVIQGEAHQDA